MTPTREQITKDFEKYKDTEIKLCISFANAWLLFSTIQVTLRQPNLSDKSRTEITTLAKRLEPHLTTTPSLTQLANDGWNLTLNIMPD